MFGRSASQAITAEPTKQTQIDSQTFTIRVSDHDESLGLFREILDYQRSRPDIYYYTRSHSYFRPDPATPEQEIWMFVDEYDNREVYWQSLTNAMADERSAANFEAFQKLVVSPPPTGHIVWTELPELRVQYAFREPLWPGCATGANGPDDALTAQPTEETQFDQGVFVVNASDHDVFTGKLKVALQHQQAHPETFYYTRSRCFYRPHPHDPAKELISFFDEYDNRDAYMKALMNVATSQAPAAARVRELAGDFTKHVVFDDSLSSLEHLVWTELKDLRVQYKFREPLWPGRADD